MNDLTRLSQPFLDRCQVIRLAPPTPTEIGVIAAREIERRGLEPELVSTITKGVRQGKITSLRTLHKLLGRLRPRLRAPSCTEFSLNNCQKHKKGRFSHD